MINENRIINNFIEMVKISSQSKNERIIGDYLINKLKSLGLEVHEDTAGTVYNGNCGNIIGILKGSGTKKLLFSAHMDTVVPCGKITPIIEETIIKSDGTSILGGDDKSGIAAIIEAIETIKENNIEHPEIIVVFSMAEEIGLLGAKVFDIKKYAPDYCFILDSSGKPGEVIVQSPTSAKGEMKLIGKPAHAGIEPEKGINALYVASHAISKMSLGRIDADTTSNIGIVKGGEAVNIVMPEVSMMYEARSFSKEKLENLLAETDRLFKEVAKEHEAEFINNVEIGYNGFKIEKGEPVLKAVEGAANKLGLVYKEKSSGGGSDANIYSAKGYISVNLATGMSKVHTTEEFIEKKDIADSARLVLGIIEEFNK
ncbi:M20/M25/M40 family metallo-hydrolase [Fusobacterium sp. PH5-44]|uniref:M20/M25/M40 family metallo-hydrolase n=1 Tax=unclassified Fusobacterium TaxID=2648384 RepID=UPI003D1B0A12